MFNTTFNRIMVVFLLLVMFVLGSGFSCSGDKRSAFEKGFAASVRVSATGASAGEAIIKAYNDGTISLETKNKIFDKLGLISTGGRQFHNILAGLVLKYPDGRVPAADLEPLNLLFAREVYGPLTDILGLAGVLTASQRATIELAMEGLRLVIMTIRGTLGKLTGRTITAGPARGHSYYASIGGNRYVYV